MKCKIVFVPVIAVHLMVDLIIIVINGRSIGILAPIVILIYVVHNTNLFPLCC